MTISADFLQYVLDQLAPLGGLSSRRMFGAIGLYCEGKFFGLIAGDALFFKVSDINRADYESRGMRRFRPYADRPLLSMRYYEVPVDVLEDAEECVLWARRSVSIAEMKSSGASSKPKRRKRARKR
jgi:DNA transformation protein